MTTDAEASSAVESVDQSPTIADLPILKENLPADWQAEHPVLCVAGRSLIDEATAIMLAHLSSAGLAARFEEAEALSTTNFFRLDITRVAWSTSMPRVQHTCATRVDVLGGSSPMQLLF